MCRTVPITLEAVKDCLGYKIDQIELCDNIECSPPYGDKEDCEFYDQGFCRAKVKRGEINAVQCRRCACMPRSR